jgi:predicted transcriptional regulator
MHAEPIDAVVLRLLVEDPGPWHVGELEREFDKAPPVRDALSRLAVAGMVHRIEGDFVFASASGRYAHAMGEVAE